ncbi:hypothetical protein TWF481_011840 [Arthrobotrys musiformis]|uniref:Uncharacterized protein n=1 Tax=Arthrobotrys musiformis TaxID=47236 RepID=A0AAV9VV85_9PEZI
MDRLSEWLGRRLQDVYSTAWYRTYDSRFLDTTIEVLVIPKGPLMRPYFGLTLLIGDVLGLLLKCAILPWPEVFYLDGLILQCTILRVAGTLCHDVYPHLPSVGTTEKVIWAFFSSLVVSVWLLLTGFLTWCWFKRPSHFDELVKLVVRRRTGGIETVYWIKKPRPVIEDADSDSEDSGNMDAEQWGVDDWSEDGFEWEGDWDNEIEPLDTKNTNSMFARNDEVFALLGRAVETAAPYLRNGQFLAIMLIAIGYAAAACPLLASGLWFILAPALSMALALLKYLPAVGLAHMFFVHPKTYDKLAGATIFFVGKLVSILGDHFHGLTIEWMGGHPGLLDFVDQVSKMGLGQWIQDFAVRIADPPQIGKPTTPGVPSPAKPVGDDTTLVGGLEADTGVCGPNSSAPVGAELGSRSGVEASPAASAEFSPGEAGPVTVPRYNLYSPVQVWYTRGSRFRDPETPCPRRVRKKATGATKSPITPSIRVRSERFPTPPPQYHHPEPTVRFALTPAPPAVAVPTTSPASAAEECETLAELVVTSIAEPRPERSVVQRYASDAVRPPPGFEEVAPGTPFWMKPALAKEILVSGAYSKA